MNYALMMARLLVAPCLAATLLAGNAPEAYLPLPAALDIPRPADELERLQSNADTAAMRAHGWRLWTGLTSTNAAGVPVWQTWMHDRDVLRDDADPHSGPDGSALLSAVPTSSGEARLPAHGSQLSAGAIAYSPIRRPSAWVSVFFNKPAADHIQANRYGSRATFVSLKAALDAAGAAPERRSILEFPRDAIAVKAIWRIVPTVPAPGEVWTLPVWDPAPADAPRNPSAAYPPSKWSRSVVLDFSRGDVPPDATVALRIPGQPANSTPRSRVVSVNDFYRIALTPAQPDAINASPGDQALLVGLHVATKELPEWVWATYWWHDRPDDGEFAAGKPASRAGTVWNHYLMTVAFGANAASSSAPSMSVGSPGDSQALQPVAFNPWLEAGFKRGILSNCISCHQQASLTSDLHTTPFTPVRRGLLPDNDPSFGDRIRTDFIWSLARVGNTP